ncbi:LLM class flavin-dependent oxidoreductase [Microbacterium elymi]|uniref:LLM class flavin-dependent oxidoreductase n=1 Tax=Microbacterium elymi TaxID=2909587 RepID=UPI0033903A6A
MLGIGSGQASGPVLAPMRNGIDALRAGTDAPIVVGALGPKMRALAAEAGDGMLLSWLTPQDAAAQTARAHLAAPGCACRALRPHGPGAGRDAAAARRGASATPASRSTPRTSHGSASTRPRPCSRPTAGRCRPTVAPSTRSCCGR